jgi:hypothetical protein
LGILDKRRSLLFVLYLRKNYFKMYGKIDNLAWLIEQIGDLQQQSDPRFWASGLFESERRHAFLPYRRPDNNIFFSASIALILQQIRPLVPEPSQQLIDQIVARVTFNYPTYQNKDGLATYNFFPTKPTQHFGNGWLLHRFRYFKLPDDIDDTALVYLTQTHSQENVQWLHQKLAQHSNRGQIVNTFPEYREWPAYSTWFGEQMYGEFDACAISNMQLCLRQYELPLNAHDEACLAYLGHIVETRRYIEAPFRCAHHYVRAVAVVYHIVRLMEVGDLPFLADKKDQIIADIENVLSQKNIKNIDKIIFYSCLLKLGKLVPSLLPEVIEEALADEDFYFFIAGFLTAFEYKNIYQIAHWPIWHFRWYCRAFRYTLVAEYLALAQQQS